MRLVREDRFAYNKSPYWFVLVTTAQKADYILLNHSAGAVLWNDPSDKTMHIIGGGVQRILGEQVFSQSDYKWYSPLEDNPYEMDFPHLQAMLKESFTSKPEFWMVDYQGKKMWELKAERILVNLMRAPSIMSLIIDPATGLPAGVEFTGYDDPKAYMSMAVSNIKTNTALKQGATKF